jgi:hypothetical protein
MRQSPPDRGAYFAKPSYVETARRHEWLYVAPLIDAAHGRGFAFETCAMDKGYDNTRVYAECEERNVEPVIPLRGAKAQQTVMPIGVGGRLFPRIGRHTDRFRELYRRRVAVEGEFGRLKTHYGLTPLRIRGRAKVQLHADLTVLARSSQALARAQVLPLAA